ncbi:MAG TPA: hypothetical protein VFP69_12365 [Streptomyces sp.]|nr:hypothetical protein [Streptomyces sp.]
MFTLIRRVAGAALATALVLAVPVTSATASDNSDVRATTTQSAPVGTPAGGFRTGDDPSAKELPRAPKDGGVRATAWNYYITSSCSGRASQIRQGANFWGGAVETSSSGTPVECTGGYVQGCGSGLVVGCNWGAGDRIMLSTLVSDFALLAAHEFGHNWYGHSPAGCANWASAYEVMRPTMC